MKSKLAETYLSRLLIIVGVGLTVAFAFAAMPQPWLAEMHRWLGLGEFPLEIIATYLARSTSLLYGLHGVVMIAIGLNLRQHFALAKLLGWLHVGLGIAMLAIDFTSAMPWWWTAFEGPPVAVTGGLIVWLSYLANDDS